MLFDTRRFHQSGNSCERVAEREVFLSQVASSRGGTLRCESSKSVEGNREGRHDTGGEKEENG